jgi:CheY-like chemotaxis protein
VTVRLLIVDDSQRFLSTTRAVLASHGAEILTAGTAAEALSVMASLTVDAILVDLQLGSESGFELVRRLRERPALAGTPILVISTRPGEGLDDIVASSGADGFLSKADLSIDRIEALIGTGRHGPPDAA